MNVKTLMASAAIALFAFTLSPVPADAADVSVVTFAMPPAIVNNGGAADGPVTKFVQELLKGTGVSSEIELTPLARVHETLTAGDTIGFPMGHTPEREKKYKYIIELYREPLMFVTLPPNKPINSLEEGKKVATVGVSNGSITEAFLKKNEFTNLEGVASTTQTALKLFEGKVDAWFATASAVRGGIQEHGQGKAAPNIGKPVADNPLWVVSSMNLPDETVAKIRARFEELKGSPLYKDMVAATSQ